MHKKKHNKNIMLKEKKTQDASISLNLSKIIGSLCVSMLWDWWSLNQKDDNEFIGWSDMNKKHNEWNKCLVFSWFLVSKFVLMFQVKFLFYMIPFLIYQVATCRMIWTKSSEYLVLKNK